MDFRHEKLEVWTLAMEYARIVYDITETLPRSEQFGLTTQIRRAAVSVALNIAEGASRQTKKEFSQFIRIAIGSLMEADTGLKIALLMKFINHEVYQKSYPLTEKLYFKLIGLNKTLR